MSNQLQELIKRKDKIEDDIKELYEVLKSQGEDAIGGALVDREGYPRNDIDVYQVRTVRNKIACLQTDHKSIMKGIEEGLYSLHAATKEKDAAKTTQIEIIGEAEAFAKVNFVSKDSPAEAARIQPDDKIIQFGSVKKFNFANMQTIANIVRYSEAKNIEVYVLRNGEKLRLVLTPKKWKGNGLLGCNIVPL